MPGRSCCALALCGFLALCLSGAGQSPPTPALEGKYLGTLNVGTKLRLLIHLKKKGEGFQGTLDSVDQGAKGIPIDSVEVKNGQVTLTWKLLAATFEGQLNEKGALVGKWKQSGFNLDVTFERTTQDLELARPQLPKKPYPYREEEVAFENNKAGVKLAGTLTLPKGEGPFSAAVLLSGSGPQDRDATIFGHKVFLVLADHLTRNGIAVLRFDDRGVGKSTGKIFDSTISENANDALAAVAYLKTRKDIAPLKIGLIGHSEGGIAGPLAATRSADVAFVVMLAGTGLPGDEILYLQGETMIRALGLGEELVRLQRSVQKTMIDIVRKEKDNAKAKVLVNAALEAEIAKQSEPLRKALEERKPLIEAQLKVVTTPWFRDFIDHDPRPALRKLQCPTLALLGALDVQVPPKENSTAIEKCLKEAGNRDATVRVLPKLNHLFQQAKTGSITEYAPTEETFNPAALRLISDWIVERVGRK